MLNITVNWPLTRPPYPAAPDSHPIQGGEYTSLRSPVESCGTLVSTHSPTSEAGRGRWWRSHQRGSLFHRPLGRLPGFIIMAPPYFQKGAHHGLCPLSDSDATLGPCVSTGPYAPLPRSGRPLREYRPAHQLTSPLYHTDRRCLCWRKAYSALSGSSFLRKEPYIKKRPEGRFFIIPQK